MKEFYQDKVDYLREYLSVAPISMALPRAIECRLFSQQRLKPPILDLGCGDGLFTHILLKGSQQRIYMGMDLEIEQLLLAKGKDGYDNLAVGDIQTIPFQTGYFQTVISNSVLEHVGDLSRALSEIYRVLAPGGYFIFNVPNANTTKNYLYSTILRKVGLVGTARAYGSLLSRILKHRNFWAKRQWEHELNRIGFKVVLYKSWHSKRLLHLCDFFYPFGSFMKINKRFFKKMVIRPKCISIFLQYLFLPFYRKESSKLNQEGVNHFFVTTKVLN